MKVKLIAALCLLFSVSMSFAQSKVFNQVSDEISTQMKVITQDNALIGYLVFTQLEKVNEDSFNYKVSILDENLNDIGALNFREESLDLQAVSFEQDVLCLAYLKSNVIGNKFTSSKSYKKAASNAKNSVFTQFINLQGKIIQTNNYSAEINVKESYIGYSQKIQGAGELKHDLVLKNIPRLGFACFFGDEIKSKLITFNTAGKQVWQKDVPEAEGFALLTTEENIYILSKKKTEMLEGGFEVKGYRVVDATSYDRYVLKDKKGNSLKVLGFDNDPATGKPLITGNIIDSRYGDKFLTAKKLTKGAYDGVFTVALNGPKKSDIKETFTYWNDGSQGTTISNTGLYVQNNTYTNLAGTIRDYNGNTYFIGSSLIKKTKWGTIISSVVLAPFVFVSPLLLTNGTLKCKVTDAVLYKQDANGKLSVENTIPCDPSKFYPARAPIAFFNTKKFYNVNNASSKSNFLIVDDLKNIVIYNVNSKKIVRTVPHKDGNTTINIFPAKEGHIMVSEYNKKEKYTRLSIEALS